MGESYFAFCQAVAENGTRTRAFAVDTWRGDQHTRPYDNVVYEEVKAHNEAHYAGFSTLLRMTFDEAAERFGEQSIDLLHIDGAHTYDAVSHDFLAWWPKVKHGGVVVLHDAFERQWEFGVWQLLEELRSAGLPVGEFVHSHGLGVVVKPPVKGDENVATALVTADSELTRQMRTYYETCAWSLQGRFLHAKKAQPAEWEVITQLFWRTEDQPFTEQESVQLAHVVSATPHEVFLNIPPSPVPYSGFRLALTLIPALLRLFAIRVVDDSGAVIWEQSEETGVLFSGDPQQTYMDLALPASVQAGGRLCLIVAGVDPLSTA